MKLLYGPETDSLYINLNARPSAGTQEVVDGIMVEVDAVGHLVSIDIQHASHKVDLSMLKTRALPARNLKLG